ncbi:MAG TPA: IS4 family transposase [Candidatus Acidoferrales bacterium]|nr:IS4 family transposase [Candidatus Acidoferrales bacterium]
MNLGRTVFAQLMDFIPAHEFRCCVKRYRGNYKVTSFSCWDQFLCMAFAQLTYRESLRDIATCLRAVPQKLYHLGFRSRVSRSTLADANETRDWRIYSDLAHVLIRQARALYAGEEFGVELDETVYALDCTTIDLCLSLFPWARYRALNAGIKVHTLLDLRGSIPSFLDISPAKIHEIHILDQLLPEPGAVYLMDRAYLDFGRLYTLTQCLAFFIIRSRKDFAFHRIYSHSVDKSSGVRCDQTIRLKSFYPAQGYPDRLRRIGYVDAKTGKHLTFLTNNFLFPALTVAQLYKCRWQIELFFKWIKQHLRIQKFYGLSENAVKTQVWIAISVYVLVAIVRKRLGLELSLYTMAQILSLTLFEKTELLQALTEFNCQNQMAQPCNQFVLFNL